MKHPIHGNFPKNNGILTYSRFNLNKIPYIPGFKNDVKSNSQRFMTRLTIDDLDFYHNISSIDNHPNNPEVYHNGRFILNEKVTGAVRNFHVVESGAPVLVKQGNNIYLHGLMDQNNELEGTGFGFFEK